MNKNKPKVISEMRIPDHKKVTLWESGIKEGMYIVVVVCMIRYELDFEERFQDDLDGAINKYIELTAPANGG